MKKRVLKKKYRRMIRKIKATFLLLVFLTIIFLIIYGLIKLFVKKEYIENINYNNGTLKINLYDQKDEIYCIIDSSTPQENSDWIKINDNICNIEYIENSNIFIKDSKNNITNITKKLLYAEIIESEKIYIPIDGEYNIFKYVIGKSDNIKYTNYDENIIKIKNNKIIGIKEGTTNLHISYNESNYTIEVNITSLLSTRKLNNNKEYLVCNRYNESDNDKLDLILKNRIENVGYKTRAGVVEAARFLTLDFPYKINYFYENGRQTTNKVDGEGRYYHVGLYLNSTRYKGLTGSTTLNNRGAWGCSLYSYPVKKKLDNGLDCSGFVSWALLNGGFDVKDVGAGWADDEDLTDFGDVEKLDEDILKSNKIKVGDLLHSEELGGHIAIIIGIDDNHYYVAQALWKDDIGIIISKYNSSTLMENFGHVILMDKYYINDGYLTNMW